MFYTWKADIVHSNIFQSVNLKLVYNEYRLHCNGDYYHVTANMGLFFSCYGLFYIAEHIVLFTNTFCSLGASYVWHCNIFKLSLLFRSILPHLSGHTDFFYSWKIKWFFSLIGLKKFFHPETSSFYLLSLPILIRIYLKCCKLNFLTVLNQAVILTRVIQYVTLSSLFHFFCMSSLKKDCKNQGLGRNRTKSCLLDMTGSLHSWTYSNCGCMHKIAQDQASQHSIMEWEGASRAPTPDWGAMDSWELLGKVESVFLRIWLLVSQWCSKRWYQHPEVYWEDK